MTYVSCYYHAFQGAMQVPGRVYTPWPRVYPDNTRVLMCCVPNSFAFSQPTILLLKSPKSDCRFSLFKSLVGDEIGGNVKINWHLLQESVTKLNRIPSFELSRNWLVLATRAIECKWFILTWQQTTTPKEIWPRYFYSYKITSDVRTSIIFFSLFRHKRKDHCIDCFLWMFPSP